MRGDCNAVFPCGRRAFCPSLSRRRNGLRCVPLMKLKLEEEKRRRQMEEDVVLRNEDEIAS